MWRSYAAAAVLVLGACRADAGAPIVFLSDFGTRDDAVAICKGVMLDVAPAARVIDLTHEVAPFSIADGARLLASASPYYPAGTVFLAVVDPGVGSARKPMIARTKRDQYFVVPDNGLVTLVADRDGLAGTREIANPRWMRAGGRSSTFHGRDVFAPAAAHLARGEAWTAAGPPIASPVRIEVPLPHIDGDVLRGEVVALDGPYGNLVTNVDAALVGALGYVLGDVVDAEIAGAPLRVPFVRTFSDVADGAPLVYIDSRGHLGVALNHASFAEAHHVQPPAPLLLRRKSR